MRMREIGPHSIAKLASFRLLIFVGTVGKRKLEMEKRRKRERCLHYVSLNDLVQRIHALFD